MKFRRSKNSTSPFIPVLNLSAGNDVNSEEAYSIFGLTLEVLHED